MAHLWSLVDQDWQAASLESGIVQLSSSEPKPAEAGGVFRRRLPNGHPVAVVIMKCRGGEPNSWAVIARRPSDVSVNGEPVHTGMRVLRDRDRIRTAGGEFFFSTELLPCIERFEKVEEAAACPRCKQEIAASTTIVRCPKCRVAHHQDDQLPCWTGYQAEPFDTCALCEQLATLGTDFRWSPAEL